MKKVLVPQNDIDNIEKARIELSSLISDFDLNQDIKSSYLSMGLKIINQTSPLWTLTHRRYKQPFWNKIKCWWEKI